jgi:hypothetical protein
LSALGIISVEVGSGRNHTVAGKDAAAAGIERVWIASDIGKFKGNRRSGNPEIVITRRAFGPETKLHQPGFHTKIMGCQVQVEPEKF